MAEKQYAPSLVISACMISTLLAGPAVLAQDNSSSLNDFGVTGLLQMPSARLASGDAAWFSLTHSNPYRHWVVGGKFTPWLEVAFRQSESLNGDLCRSSCFDDYWASALSLGRGEQVGRSLDVKLLLREESFNFPAIALGFQDMFGRGTFRGEYLVATKRKGAFDLTFGLGWGYLGSMTDVSNPMRLFGDGFDFRSQDAIGQEQKAHKDWFAGQAIGFFGGVEYQTPYTGLSVKAEWSSIDPSNTFEQVSRRRRFPIGIGINWTPRKWFSSGLAFEDGNRLMFRFSLSADLTRSFQPKPRYSNEAVARVKRENAALQGERPEAKLQALLAGQGFVIAAQSYDADKISLTLSGSRQISSMEIAFTVFTTMPAGVKRLDLSVGGQETFVITRSMVLEESLTGPAFKDLDEDDKPLSLTHKISVQLPLYNDVIDVALGEAISSEPMLHDDVKLVDVSVSDIGIELASISFVRAHLSRFDKGILTGAELLSSSRIEAGPRKLLQIVESSPRFKWSVGPVLEQQLGGNAVMKADIFARAKASVRFGQGIEFDMGARQRIAGNLDTLVKPVSSNSLPTTRGDLISYLDRSSPMIDRMALSMTRAVGNNIFVKAEAGILESQFSAVGGELVYMPPTSRWAVGGELYYAAKRYHNDIFDLKDYRVTTGHVTLFREFSQYAATAKLSAGRYLGGDWGMTLDLVREFDSGIRLGVYSTVTETPGNVETGRNFIKGAYLSLPLNLFWGNERGAPFRFDFTKLLENAGQRLSTGRSLYDQLQSGRAWRIQQSWPK